MKNLILLGVFALMFTACGQEQGYNEEAKDEQKEEVQNGEHAVHFGEIIDEEGAIGFDEMLEMMGEADSMYAKVIAKVDDVCQKKGCWMNVYSADGSEAESMFVQFHDYGFFMPLDLDGGLIVMEGYAYRDWTSVAELQHYAEDAGQSPEEIAAITEPVHPKGQ
jgi:hypothetical protein